MKDLLNERDICRLDYQLTTNENPPEPSSRKMGLDSLVTLLLELKLCLSLKLLLRN